MLALTRTCRQARLEAWPAFFATTTWTIRLSNHEGLMERLDKLGPGAQASFKDVEILASGNAYWDWGNIGHEAIASKIVGSYREIADRLSGTGSRLKLVMLGPDMSAPTNEQDDRTAEPMNFELSGLSALDGNLARNKLDSFIAAGDLLIQKAEVQAVHELETQWMKYFWYDFTPFLRRLVNELDS